MHRSSKPPEPYQGLEVARRLLSGSVCWRVTPQGVLPDGSGVRTEAPDRPRNDDWVRVATGEMVLRPCNPANPVALPA
jgi:hypothetical protein